jgi:hypothetical protein
MDSANTFRRVEAHYFGSRPKETTPGADGVSASDYIRRVHEFDSDDQIAAEMIDISDLSTATQDKEIMTISHRLGSSL